MKRLGDGRLWAAAGFGGLLGLAALLFAVGGSQGGVASAQDAVPTPFVITATPTPADVLAAATAAARQTAQATITGTVTPLPLNWVIATSTPTPRLVTATPTAENGATATVMVAQATAIAFTTGTPPPNLVVVTLTPTPAPTYVTPPSGPTPDIVQQAALAAESTRLAATQGTPTPTPTNWKVARVVVLPNPNDGANSATAVAAVAQATALAFLNPGPGVVFWTATPRPIPTGTPVFVYLNDLTPTPVGTGAPTFPSALVGKILFLSDVLSGAPSRPDAFMMNPDGSGLAKLTSREFYDRAKAREAWSPDRRYRAFAETEQGGSKRTQIFYNDAEYGTVKQLTYYGVGVAWDPAWSPVEDLAAFVATESNGDEIWIAQIGQNPATRLTFNTWEWDKSPSFSPDGQQILFMSNRNGRQELWVMNKDGGDQRLLTALPFEAWGPVWVKYGDG